MFREDLRRDPTKTQFFSFCEGVIPIDLISMEITGESRTSYLYPMTLAPKPGNPNGKLCNNLPKGLRKSTNANVDLSASNEEFPLGTLPNIRDVTEMGCQQWALTKGASILSATVNIATT